MEEPVCEPPAIALYYVSRLAKQYVKVLLSGEGGDEAFAGYQNYRNLLWLERIKSALGPFNGLVSAGLSGINSVFHSDKVAKYAPLFRLPMEDYYYSRTSSPFGMFNRGTSLYSHDLLQHLNQGQAAVVLKQYFDHAGNYDRVNRMLYVDTKTWLTDDLLLKADKMTMANSIELRVPLLDHKLLEFAASLPGHYKVRGFTTKYIAKKVLNKRVPQAILDRRKTGFPVPYSSWLRKEMKAWVSDVLLDRRSIGRGYFEKKGVEALLRENAQNGRYPKEVFSLVTLELWHRSFLEPNNRSDFGLETSATSAAPDLR
jgi:asparagine synthase (glutamine-hydrolysing)